MPVLMNNCLGYDHAALYGPGAFFDLPSTGPQATMATNLPPCMECVVAGPDRAGEVVFTWFSFAREVSVRTADGKTVRVFFGERLRSETLARPDAIKTEPYSS